MEIFQNNMKMIMMENEDLLIENEGSSIEYWWFVHFLLKNLHFLLKNHHCILKNLHFSLENLHFPSSESSFFDQPRDFHEIPEGVSMDTRELTFKKYLLRWICIHNKSHDFHLILGLNYPLRNRLVYNWFLVFHVIVGLNYTLICLGLIMGLIMCLIMGLNYTLLNGIYGSNYGPKLYTIK